MIFLRESLPLGLREQIVGEKIMAWEASGQIIIFQEIRFPWNKGISIPKRYLLGEIGRVMSL